MISLMLLTLSGPSRKNAAVLSHNSTRNQYIMQRATFFQTPVFLLLFYFIFFTFVLL